MTDNEFLAMAEQILSHLAYFIEDHDPNGELEVDFNHDILTIVNSSGTFVLNKQSALKEIWLSSPISGPYHFAHRNNSWYSKSGHNLYKVLSRELKIDLQELSA